MNARHRTATHPQDDGCGKELGRGHGGLDEGSLDDVGLAAEPLEDLHTKFIISSFLPLLTMQPTDATNWSAAWAIDRVAEPCMN